MVDSYIGKGSSNAEVLPNIPSEDVETEALGYLAGRASFTTYENGELIVGQYAIKLLVDEGIPFTFHGLATYAQTIPALRLRELEFRPDDTEKS